MRTGIVTDPVFETHQTGAGHPERSERIASVQNMLEQQSWYDDLHQVKPVAVTPDKIELVHGANYADRVAAACESGEPWIDTPDVAVNAASFDVASKATGSLLSLVDAVMEEKVKNGFAVVRPPGHHAEQDTAMGFCLFNSVAIAARHLQQHHGLERVLILDWDVHHGNGTQHTFEQDPSVMFMSLHQFPHYPGSGSAAEGGIGAGEGTTVNCPMNAGAGNADYLQAFEEVILPKALSFKPDFVLVSAGFDAHEADPLGSINLTDESYNWMTKVMMNTAEYSCNGRLVSVLEGGYNLNALARSATTHVDALLNG